MYIRHIFWEAHFVPFTVASAVRSSKNSDAGSTPETRRLTEEHLDAATAIKTTVEFITTGAGLRASDPSRRPVPFSPSQIGGESHRHVTLQNRHHRWTAARAERQAAVWRHLTPDALVQRLREGLALYVQTKAAPPRSGATGGRPNR